MEGADIVDMVKKDRTNSRRAGELISKISKWFKDATSKPRRLEKKASISTPTESERQCSSMGKNRPEVDQVDLSCQSKGRKENNEGFEGKIANQRERVKRSCRSVAKRIMAACDNLCIKQKRVALSHSSYSNCSQERSEYEGKSKSSPSCASEQRQTTCTDSTKYTQNYSSRARVEKDVTPVTKTAANNDFSYSSLATMTEKKGKLVSTSQSNGVRITKAKIVSHASKQREEDIEIIFHEIEGESPRDRDRRYESFKDHQSYLHTERKIEAVRQQEGVLQLERARDLDEKMKGADALDSRIQKWSHGNEGNLRALLSTLDNALWPGCNWKMVRASELVMASSVKAVYRKATFCLHPDKVQQRGGTIEQKYVAQIVFGILREAWNKFHREELG